MFSNVRRVLSQCITRLRLLYLLNNRNASFRSLPASTHLVNVCVIGQKIESLRYMKYEISGKYQLPVKVGSSEQLPNISPLTPLKEFRIGVIH